MQECPRGTFKNVTGSDKAHCLECPSNELPHRAKYVAVRGILIPMLISHRLKYFFGLAENLIEYYTDIKKSTVTSHFDNFEITVKHVKILMLDTKKLLLL